MKRIEKPTIKVSHQNLEEETSDSDTDINDENDEPDARIVENEGADDANLEDVNDDPRIGENCIENHENEEQIDEEPMHVRSRPQRAAKNEAYRKSGNRG